MVFCGQVSGQHDLLRPEPECGHPGGKRLRQRGHDGGGGAGGLRPLCPSAGESGPPSAVQRHVPGGRAGLHLYPLPRALCRTRSVRGAWVMGWTAYWLDRLYLGRWDIRWLGYEGGGGGGGLGVGYWVLGGWVTDCIWGWL